MPNVITESEVEELALEILNKDLKYDILHGPDIAPDGATPERKSYSDVILVKRFVDRPVIKRNI